MTDMTGKSYNETAPLGAEVDATNERELEAVRAARRDGTLGEAQGSGTVGERVAETVTNARERVAEAASGLYAGAKGLVRGRAGEVGTETRMTMTRLVEERPLTLFLGAALAGFLLGRFG